MQREYTQLKSLLQPHKGPCLFSDSFPYIFVCLFVFWPFKLLKVEGLNGLRAFKNYLGKR